MEVRTNSVHAIYLKIYDSVYQPSYERLKQWEKSIVSRSFNLQNVPTSCRQGRVTYKDYIFYAEIDKRQIGIKSIKLPKSLEEEVKEYLIEQKTLKKESESIADFLRYLSCNLSEVRRMYVLRELLSIINVPVEDVVGDTSYEASLIIQKNQGIFDTIRERTLRNLIDVS